MITTINHATCATRYPPPSNPRPHHDSHSHSHSDHQYGDITPCNDIERAFAALVMVVGVLTYSYIVAKMTEIVTYIDINSHSAREVGVLGV